MKKNNQKLHRDIQRVFAENARKLLNYKQVASKLGIEDNKGREELLIALKILDREGVIEEIQPGKYVARLKHQFITGRVDMTQRGQGYLVPDEGQDITEDLYISSDYLNTALNGDKVKVQMMGHKISDKQAAEVVEVLERNRTDFVGTLQVNASYGFLVCDDKKMYVDIFIPQDKYGKAKNGDKVIARIVKWTPDDNNPVGEVVEVLGKPGNHETEMNAIVAEFGFPLKFNPETEKEAEKISDKIGKDEIAKRRDFRKILTFTIDPEDAKDFDDAISYEVMKDGTFEIGIHIADVSHFVRPGTQLEKEAYDRATSVYLVDRTIPMLPEKLSNGVCSLRPHEEKLTFSVVVKMNEKAEVLDTWIGKTVIYSDRRFSYEEAQERIENKEGDLCDEINILNKLALILREQRFKKGAISFETQEVKFRLDENFKPTDVYAKDRKDAHKLIEEFMLLANRIVAEYGSSQLESKKPKTFVYRSHDLPNEDKLKVFSTFAARFGYKVNVESPKNVAKALNHLLEEVEGKPEQNVLQSQAVRTMQKAMYTTKKTSHYGLAFEHYTHFTSPIRRYPDLMTHRLLFEYLHGEKSAPQDKYEEACKHSSAMEVKASDAERASIRYKQVEYIKDFVGTTFQGIISGMSEWGIYVEITKFKCEGMLRLTNINDDYYQYDNKNQWIVGQRTGRKFQFGDTLEVVVISADIIKRQIDLSLLETETMKSFRSKWEKGKSKKSEASKKSGGGRKTRRGSK